MIDPLSGDYTLSMIEDNIRMVKAIAVNLYIKKHIRKYKLTVMEKERIEKCIKEKLR